ncbi:MAG: hypothetical protein RIA09_20255 [Hoeflea sp.]
MSAPTSGAALSPASSPRDLWAQLCRELANPAQSRYLTAVVDA